MPEIQHTPIDTAPLQMFSAGVPKLADAEKFEVNQMPQLYECGKTVNDKQWLGVGASIQCDALTKLWVSGGRYPQVIATIVSASDLFNFMVNFNPEAATQGFAAQSLISALSGLYNYNKSFDTDFALTVKGNKAVFVNCYVPGMDAKHREAACTPLSRNTDEIKAEIGWIQDKLGQTPQYEPRCSETLKQLREPIAA